MKDLWQGILGLWIFGTVITAGCGVVGTAVIYFKTSWEHMNEKHYVKIKGGSIQINSGGSFESQGTEVIIESSNEEKK